MNTPLCHAEYFLVYNNQEIPLQDVSFDLKDLSDESFMLFDLRCIMFEGNYVFMKPTSRNEERFISLIQRYTNVSIKYVLFLTEITIPRDNLFFMEELRYLEMAGYIMHIEPLDCPICNTLKKEYIQTGAIKLLDTEMVL